MQCKIGIIFIENLSIKNFEFEFIYKICNAANFQNNVHAKFAFNLGRERSCYNSHFQKNIEGEVAKIGFLGEMAFVVTHKCVFDNDVAHSIKHKDT